MRHFSDADFEPKVKKRRRKSSSSDSIFQSPIRDRVKMTGDFGVVYVATDFKVRKSDEHSAGIAIYWGDGHSGNETLPLRGKKLTHSQAQLLGKINNYSMLFSFSMLILSS